MSGHRHVFERTVVLHDDGSTIEGGRRCACGLEVVGDGPFAISAEFIRISRRINASLSEALRETAKALNRGSSFPR